jgi:hypothetical protein
MNEVALDQLRQALFERCAHLSDIPALVAQLAQTDWALWLNDMGARVMVCAGCHRYMRAADSTTLPELAWLGEARYCYTCAEQVRLAHTFACEVCGHAFYAQHAPTPFALCPECDTPGISFALSSLWAQLQRARKLNRSATLSPRQWLDTLEYFGWRCAYCQRAEFACLDHFVPVVKGGGTTQANCVPACISCNSIKGGKHPQGATHSRSLSPATLARVQQYLAQFAEGA